MADYELFWQRIKMNDKVLVKAPIQNKVNKECYFLGTVTAKSIHEDDKKHVVVIQLEGETKTRGIKLEEIGKSIEDVKKRIIPMDFIFKDENIKAVQKIPGEIDCDDGDIDCDGTYDETELDELSNQDGQGKTQGNEALEVKDIKEEDFKDIPPPLPTEQVLSQVATDQQSTGKGGKKKKKKNRSRSKKNKKKRKRKNSTKKKN